MYRIIKTLDALLHIKDTFEFIAQVNQKRDELLDLAEKHARSLRLLRKTEAGLGKTSLSV